MSKNRFGLRFSILAAVIGLAVLGACGNMAQSPGAQIATGLLARATGGAASAASLDPRNSLTREMIDAAGQPLLLVVIPARNAAASLTVAGQNGDKITWISAGGQSVTVRDGLVIATRALGADLMGLRAPGGIQAIRNGGTSARAYEFLNGEDQIARMDVTCESTVVGVESLSVIGRDYPTQKVVETCVFEEISFENSYWFAPDGELRKSIQWVSFGVDVIEITWL